MLKKLFKESLIYGLSGYISKFISIFLLPLYTSVLTPEDYGILDLLGTITVISSFLVISGTDSSFGYYFFRKEFADEKRKIIASSMIIRLVLSAFFSLLLFFVAPYIADLIFKKDLSVFIRITALTIAFSSVYFFLTELLRFEFRQWLYTIISSLSVLIQVLLAIYFVLILRLGVKGALLSGVISYGILFVVSIIYVFGKYGSSFSFKWAKKIFNYGFPLIGTSIAAWVLASSDRFFLNHYTGLSEVGIYAVGVKLAALIGMVSGTVQMAWGPFAADIQYDVNAKKVYAKVFEIYSICVTIAVFGISMFSVDILKVFTQPAYYSAKAVVPFLCLATSFSSAYSLAASGISLSKKLFHTIWITVTAASVNIGMNFLLTPVWGAVGAAFSLMTAYLVNFVLVMIFSQKFYPIPYRYGRIAAILLPALIAVFISYYFGLSLSVRIIMSIVFVLYCSVSIYSNYRNSIEFQYIKTALSKINPSKTEDNSTSRLNNL